MEKPEQKIYHPKSAERLQEKLRKRDGQQANSLGKLFAMSTAKKFTASPFVTVEREVGQTHDRRKGLIKKLEDHYQAKVITLFTSFKRPDVQIEDMDAEMLESVLAAEHKAGDKILLIINSPGGQALAAERIANVCRAYSTNNFEVIVPHMAKSAATMVCFGAKKIGNCPIKDQKIFFGTDEANGQKFPFIQKLK